MIRQEIVPDGQLLLDFLGYSTEHPQT